MSATLRTAGHTDNSVLIHADLDLVWELTNDVERWPELFTEYAAAEILDRDRDTVRFRLTMHPDENGRVWSWVSERTGHRDERRVVARRVEPGPFRHMDIEWTYESESGGTRMRWVQDFAMRPDAPLDDAAMTDRINTNTARQLVVIRDKVERAARERGAAEVRTIARAEVPANRRRGGDVRTVLSPATAGATSGFLGTATLEPGEVVTEHWHPYSEEFLYCVRGEVVLWLDGQPRPLRADEAVLVPIGVRHRLANEGDETAMLVFQLGPLAPHPSLGHVDTEELNGRWDA